jgi:hypothetical protein
MLARPRRAVIDSLAWQLGTTPETFEDYDWHGHTGRLHCRSIREWLGFRTPTADDAARLVTWQRTAHRALCWP